MTSCRGEPTNHSKEGLLQALINPKSSAHEYAAFLNLRMQINGPKLQKKNTQEIMNMGRLVIPGYCMHSMVKAVK